MEGAEAAGCRHAPIYLWYTLTRKGYHGMRKDVETCFRNAHILKVNSLYICHGLPGWCSSACGCLAADWSLAGVLKASREAVEETFSSERLCETLFSPGRMLAAISMAVRKIDAMSSSVRSMMRVVVDPTQRRTCWRGLESRPC